MKHKFNLASHLIISAIAMGSQFANAADDSSKRSFEDVLTSSVYSAYSVKDSEEVKDAKRETENGNQTESAFESEQHREWKEFEDRVHVIMVPEPATDAMLLAGLAVLLVTARRKQLSKGR
jgi:hypothetical protein